MSEPVIHVFNHHAMATQFQVRIAGEEKAYAEQAAQAVLALADELESRLSRFRADSEISQIVATGRRRHTSPERAGFRVPGNRPLDGDSRRAARFR